MSVPYATKKELSEEWNRRATRRGVRAVMSDSYPAPELQDASEKYVEAVMDFIAEDVDRQDVLEIGAGIGRLTEKLVKRARRVTCVEMCSKMIERSKKSLGASAESVEYVEMPAQEYSPSNVHDVAISSLVISHVVDNEEFRRLARVLSGVAATIFVFEHTGGAHRVNRYTCLRSEGTILAAFEGWGIRRRLGYRLFDDYISFMKIAPPVAKNGN